MGSAMHRSSENIEQLWARGSSYEELAATVDELRARLALLARQIAERANSEPLAPELVHSAVRARALRFDFFKRDLFPEPAWEMLLHLYAKELERQRVSASNLCLASGVPASTALRWINRLEREGLINRRRDPLDGRRRWIELSKTGAAAMNGYFEALSRRRASVPE